MRCNKKKKGSVQYSTVTSSSQLYSQFKGNFDFQQHLTFQELYSSSKLKNNECPSRCGLSECCVTTNNMFDRVSHHVHIYIRL